MENIFNNLIIPNYYYFNNKLLNITNDLYSYLYDNLNNENIDILRWDLQNTLTINANGEYI